MCFSFDYKTKFVLKSRTRVAPVAPLAAAAMTRFTTWKKKKKGVAAPARVQNVWMEQKAEELQQQPGQANGSTDTSRSFFWPLPLRDDDGGYRPFRLAAAPRAIPKKEKRKKRLVCVVLFHRLCCDAIIHLTVSCSHFFFFLV
jgi:hypothetical protein